MGLNPLAPLRPHSFLELEFPRLSKALRTTAFVYPFVYDNVPLFYRVSPWLVAPGSGVPGGVGTDGLG